LYTVTIAHSCTLGASEVKYYKKYNGTTLSTWLWQTTATTCESILLDNWDTTSNLFSKFTSQETK